MKDFDWALNCQLNLNYALKKSKLSQSIMV